MENYKRDLLDKENFLATKKENEITIAEWLEKQFSTKQNRKFIHADYEHEDKLR